MDNIGNSSNQGAWANGDIAVSFSAIVPFIDPQVGKVDMVIGGNLSVVMQDAGKPFPGTNVVSKRAEEAIVSAITNMKDVSYTQIASHASDIVNAMATALRSDGFVLTSVSFDSSVPQASAAPAPEVKTEAAPAPVAAAPVAPVVTPETPAAPAPEVPAEAAPAAPAPAAQVEYMKFCTNCGTPSSGTKFCIQCGNSLIRK